MVVGGLFVPSQSHMCLVGFIDDFRQVSQGSVRQQYTPTQRLLHDMDAIDIQLTTTHFGTCVRVIHI